MEGQTSKVFNSFIRKLDNFRANQVQSVQLNDISFVEDLRTLKILLYDKYVVEGNMIGGLARRIVPKYENRLRLLR